MIVRPRPLKLSRVPLYLIEKNEERIHIYSFGRVGCFLVGRDRSGGDDNHAGVQWKAGACDCERFCEGIG